MSFKQFQWIKRESPGTKCSSSLQGTSPLLGSSRQRYRKNREKGEPFFSPQKTSCWNRNHSISIQLDSELSSLLFYHFKPLHLQKQKFPIFFLKKISEFLNVFFIIKEICHVCILCFSLRQEPIFQDGLVIYLHPHIPLRLVHTVVKILFTVNNHVLRIFEEQMYS